MPEELVTPKSSRAPMGTTRPAFWIPAPLEIDGRAMAQNAPSLASGETYAQ